MSTNGQRKPPRPRIELLTAAESQAEAAAIVAAVERFIAETAPAPEGREQVSGWHRAALLEGVSAKRSLVGPRGDGEPWGS